MSKPEKLYAIVDVCPFVERQMDSPCGDVDGIPLYLRKLRPVSP